MGGYSGKVFRTANRGLNWTDVTPTLSAFVNDIKFLNFSTGFILEPSYKKTTNSGNNWTPSISGLYGTSLDIVNQDTLYIADRGRVLISTNCGDNWSSRPVGSSATLDCVNFVNGKTGWICGDGGLVKRTTNAGENWYSQNSGTLARLRTIQILDLNNLWIAGDSGVILRTTTGGVTFINEYTNEIPSSFNLKQNFPNPFNSQARIEFDVSRAEFVTLKIFDMQGKEISTLVNERLSPGSYEVSFDGSALSSGIYFYRLGVGKNIQTRKMTLLK
jgi:hypothetical protein